MSSTYKRGDRQVAQHVFDNPVNILAASLLVLSERRKIDEGKQARPHVVYVPRIELEYENRFETRTTYYMYMRYVM